MKKILSPAERMALFRKHGFKDFKTLSQAVAEYEGRPKPGKQLSALCHCNRCKQDVVAPVTRKNNHFRADCPLCKKYIKFVSKKDLL